jgi:hypothetical protein
VERSDSSPPDRQAAHVLPGCLNTEQLTIASVSAVSATGRGPDSIWLLVGHTPTPSHRAVPTPNNITILENSTGSSSAYVTRILTAFHTPGFTISRHRHLTPSPTNGKHKYSIVNHQTNKNKLRGPYSASELYRLSDRH